MNSLLLVLGGVLVITLVLHICNWFLFENSGRKGEFDEEARSLLVTIPCISCTRQEVRKERCSICLIEFMVAAEGEVARVFPGCNHLFHRFCLDLWLSKNTNCPVCKQDYFALERVILN